ncbi:MAG: porphobilinogen synthase, partial [Chloroflexi bacterium]|nr:porphobilinogen synthase [Chloroflexota bacterium]
MALFPSVRMRRLRESDMVRRLVRETAVSVDDLVYPIFVTHGRDVREEIEPMPGCYHFSLDRLLAEVAEVTGLGIPGVLLFGLPSIKDPVGSEAYDPHGIIQEAIRVIKQAAPSLMVITDVCLCEYTDHGHCG